MWAGFICSCSGVLLVFIKLPCLVALVTRIPVFRLCSLWSLDIGGQCLSGLCDEEPNLQVRMPNQQGSEELVGW